ncbi:hypothetical protein VTK26DRAFT_680 [Humicola hyalothermophila]
MLCRLWAGFVAAVLCAVAAASETYNDPDTGLVFSSEFKLYKADGRGITYRVAIPDDAQAYSSFDAVVQFVVPNDVGWAGLAWGGSMPQNPLLVAWRDDSNRPILSSRWATGHVAPQPYNGAQYTLFQTGTKSNSTHWQFTALCQGCSSWTLNSGVTRYVMPRGGIRMAFAYSPNRPSPPSSPTSTLTIHEVFGYIDQDLGKGLNANFQSIVERLSMS